MRTFWTSLGLMACLTGSGLGQETIAETDALPEEEAVVVETAPAPSPSAAELLAKQPVIPAPYSASRYEATWDKNPFLLKTVTPTEPQTTWAQDWALAGMFNNEGKIRVSIVNKQTGEYKHLSNQGNADPDFQLVKANFNRDRTEASAEIAKGGTSPEVIKYDDSLTSRPVTINNTQQVAANAGAAANQAGRPGAPVNPAAAGQPPGRGGPPVNPGAPNPAAGAVRRNPNVNTNSGPVPITANPPTISRRRMLVPTSPQTQK